MVLRQAVGKAGKYVLAVSGAAIAVAALAAGIAVRATVKSVPRLFQRNAELKAQGYYMGEFEFKMVAAQYHLNEGRYWKALRTLRRIGEQMKTTRGLARMPGSAAAAEMTDFLLARQDPATGAFMDPGYPYFTYIAPTLNVVEALDGMARRTGRPLQLKYPLRFLEEIRTPERLTAYLDSLLYIGESWARFPGPGPYGPGVSEVAAYEILERAGVYRFSDEWKDALRRWFYETQDPATGFWGGRIGRPGKWRQKRDINSTKHVLKNLVLDEQGRNRSAKYPLRHADALARGILESLDAPIPDDAASQHDWSLCQAQGTQMLVRQLWPHLPEASREQVRAAMRTGLARRYRLFRADGGFALYTAAKTGDVDGTVTALGHLRATGSLPGTWERERLWGKALAAAPEPARQKVKRWENATLPLGAGAQSVRIYKDSAPGDGFDGGNLVLIVYPGDSPVRDVMDLRQSIARFLRTTGQGFGNWASKEELAGRLDLAGEIRKVPVSKAADLARIAGEHPDAARFHAIGYDVFQVPVFRLEIVKETGGGAAGGRLEISAADQQVWQVEADGSRRRLTDGPTHKSAPARSPEGGKIAYFEYCPDLKACTPRLVVAAVGGAVEAGFALTSPRRGRPCVSVTAIRWLAPSRLGVDCHRNPSLSEHMEVDLRRKRVVRSWLGFGFAWSPDGRKIAYAGWIPHFAPPFAHSNYLRIQGRTVYPPEAVRQAPREPVPGDPPQQYTAVLKEGIYREIHEFRTPLAWSPDGARVAFADRVYDWAPVEGPDGCPDRERGERNVRWFLVAARAGGKWHLVPLAGPPASEARWLDTRTVELDGRRYRVEHAAGGTAAGALRPL